MSEGKAKKRWIVILLVAVPTYLIASGVVAVWGNLKVREKESQQELARFAKGLSAESMRDDYVKLTERIGVREVSGAGARGFSAAASWIEGSLGPSNTGFRVEKIESGVGQPWPILEVVLRGTDEGLPPLWVVCTYASGDGVRGSSAVVAEMAVAQALANQHLPRTVHFVFMPLADGVGQDRGKVIATLVKRVEDAKGGEILWLENFGAGAELWVMASEGNARMMELAGEMGHALPFEKGRLRGDVLDVWGAYARISRVSTAAPEVAERKADVSELRIASGRLLELIRRASSPVEKK